jgi:hypothetical protein
MGRGAATPRIGRIEPAANGGEHLPLSWRALGVCVETEPGEVRRQVAHERFGAAVAEACALIRPDPFVRSAAGYAFWTTAVLAENLALGLVQRSRHTATSVEAPAALWTFSLDAVTFRGVDQIALEASDVTS